MNQAAIANILSSIEIKIVDWNCKKKNPDSNSDFIQGKIDQLKSIQNFIENDPENIKKLDATSQDICVDCLDEWISGTTKMAEKALSISTKEVSDTIMTLVKTMKETRQYLLNIQPDNRKLNDFNCKRFLDTV